MADSRLTPLSLVALLLLAGCGVQAEPKPTIAADLCAPFGGLDRHSTYLSDTPWKYETSVHAYCKDGSTVSRSVTRPK